jgi:curved DNA-binding protein CbpA
MAKVALLIGVSEYEVGLNPLPAAVKDVVALERILKDSEMGDFDEVKVLTNPEPQAMQFEVETLFSGRSKDDFVLLFFSGHGIKDDSNNLYFATRITKKSAKGDLIRSTAVPARFVHEVMNNSRAKRQAIILDCCFSGAFDPNLQSKDDGSVDLQGQLGAEGRVVLTSSSSTQYSFEQQGSDLSLYTRYLIEGIETGAGDRDEDGKISVRELHEYATSKVQETAPSMTPKLITLKDLGFDLVLAKAKLTDPKLRYRKTASRYCNVGTIRPSGRAVLNALRKQLSLTVEETNEIENELLRPYQERIANLQQYRETLLAESEQEYPLGTSAREGLKELQQMLGLRDIDILAIQKEIESQFTKSDHRDLDRNAVISDKNNSDLEDQNNSELDQCITLLLTSEEMCQGVKKRVEIDYSKKTIKVNVPQGITVGQRIRIKGEGLFNPFTKSRGDLYLLVEKRQQVDSFDLESVIYLSKKEIYQGCQKRFETDGESFFINVPPVSDFGKKLRLKGKGRINVDTQERGDLYLMIRDIADQKKVAISKGLIIEPLGVETLGGVMTVIIPQYTAIPAEVIEVFSTAVDGQSNVEINIFKGNRSLTKDNIDMGTFRLDGIPPAPRGVPQIEVSFTVDETGTLSVFARDKATGKKSNLTLVRSPLNLKSDTIVVDH